MPQLPFLESWQCRAICFAKFTATLTRQENRQAVNVVIKIDDSGTYFPINRSRLNFPGPVNKMARKAMRKISADCPLPGPAPYFI